MVTGVAAHSWLGSVLSYRAPRGSVQFQLSSLREEIIARSRAGEELATIERELIDPNLTDEDERAALWLLAWCERRGVTCPTSS